MKNIIAAGVIAGCRSGGELSGDCGGAVSGLLNLRDDVKMCGYRDVEVMWNMLSSSLTTESTETARSTKRKKLSQRNCKQRSNSRLLFWSNHNS